MTRNIVINDKLFIASQLTVFGIILLSSTSHDFVPIRQVLGFIYLTVFPGILAIRILRLNLLKSTHLFFYSVGLSIFILMFIGLILNFSFPFIGINNPFSATSLIIAILILLNILYVVSYLCNKEFNLYIHLNLGSLLTPIILFSFLLPFMAVFGAYIVNIYQLNLLLMIMMLFIVFCVIYIIINEKNLENIYPISLYAIALALLFHRTLISNFISGWDIFLEYYFAKNVIVNSFWDMSHPNNLNGMLSITILAPIYAIFCNLSLEWVFKVFYQVTFGLVPIIIFYILKSQINIKISYLSSFFFISFQVYYGEMIYLARQEVAELFLVLIMLLLIEKNLDPYKKSILLIIFAASLIVSHYGLAYIFMFFLFLLFIISGLNYISNKLFAMSFPLLKELASIRLANSVLNANQFNLIKMRLAQLKTVLRSQKLESFSYIFILFYFVLSIAWYIYVSNTSNFNTLIVIGNHIYENIYDLGNPASVQGMDIIVSQQRSVVRDILKYLHIINIMLISIGFLWVLSKRIFLNEYRNFLLVNFSICILGLTLPFFASAFNTSRVYHIALIALSPLCIFGALRSLEYLSNFIHFFSSEKMKVTIIALYLSLFFLFNVGFISECSNDIPLSFALNGSTDYPVFSDSEVVSAKWLHNLKDNSGSIYADQYRALLLSSFEGLGILIIRDIDDPFKEDKFDHYLYLGKFNTLTKNVTIRQTKGVRYSTISHTFNDYFEKHNIIYNNGFSNILLL